MSSSHSLVVPSSLVVGAFKGWERLGAFQESRFYFLAQAAILIQIIRLVGIIFHFTPSTSVFQSSCLCVNGTQPEIFFGGVFWVLVLIRRGSTFFTSLGSPLSSVLALLTPLRKAVPFIYLEGVNKVMWSVTTNLRSISVLLAGGILLCTFLGGDLDPPLALLTPFRKTGPFTHSEGISEKKLFGELELLRVFGLVCGSAFFSFLGSRLGSVLALLTPLRKAVPFLYLEGVSKVLPIFPEIKSIGVQETSLTLQASHFWRAEKVSLFLFHSTLHFIDSDKNCLGRIVVASSESIDVFLNLVVVKILVVVNSYKMLPHGNWGRFSQGWRPAVDMGNENDSALTITEVLNPIRISVQSTEETIAFILTPYCKLLMNSLNVGCWYM